MIHGSTPSVEVVISTFKPSSDPLLPTVAMLVDQGVRPLIIDDASPCTYDPVLRQASASGARVVSKARNSGIASSLNIGLFHASSLGKDWLLTLDQDSLPAQGYLAVAVIELASLAERAPQIAALGAANVHGANAGLRYPTKEWRGITTTEEVVQSGTFWSVQTMSGLGGFNESLRIDAVDAEACLKLRENGYRIAITSKLSLAHEIGRTRTVRLLGRDVAVTQHNPQRRTSMLRNRMALFPREFAQSPRHGVRTLRRVLINQSVGLLIEQDRRQKALGTLRGLLPGNSREKA